MAVEEQWQFKCEGMQDCTFLVGTTNQEELKAHRRILAASSPVFGAMFFGNLAERSDAIICIPDIEPACFRALLQYIYSGKITLDTFYNTYDLFCAARKYMLPDLLTQCTDYFCLNITPTWACRAYEEACFFDEETVKDKCIQIITQDTSEVLSASTFVDIQLETLKMVFSLDNLNIDSELELFDALVVYVTAATGKAGPMATEDYNFQEGIRSALREIRFLSLTPDQFANGPARSALLTAREKADVLMNLNSRDSIRPMPPGFSQCRQQRRSIGGNHCRIA